MFQFLGKFVSFRNDIAIASSILPKKLGLLCFRNPLFHVKFISATSNEQSFAVSYLVSNCGVLPERAASFSKQLHFESREKPDLAIKFLENQGFSQAQALKVIGSAPKLLGFNPEKNLLPKIEFLKSRVFLTSDLLRIILADPNILMRSLEKRIVPSFDFFTNFFQSEENFVKALKRFPPIIACCTTCIIPNITLLRAEGVSESLIIKLLERHPRTFCREPHQFEVFVKEVKKMGFNPLKVTFVMAVKVLTSISKSTWARKSGAFKIWGWTDDEILAAFRTNPLCMMYSQNNIEAKLEFFVNKMGCKSSICVRHPHLLGLSLHKRIIPRNAVIQVLLLKGLVNKLNLPRMLGCSERVFMERYILYHEKEAGELLKLYCAKLKLPGGDLKAEQL